MAVKAQLRLAGIKYALLFPAKLRVIDDDKTHFFHTADAAWKWAQAKGLGIPVPSQTEDDTGWIPKKPRKRRTRRQEGRLTRKQAEGERSRLLADIASQSNNRYRALVPDSE